MPKTLCPVCNSRKGKRFCKKRENQAICSICCPELRNEECIGCHYYDTAAAYQAEKIQRSSAPAKMPKQDFIIELNEELEDQVDQALAISERGRTKEAASTLEGLVRKHPKNHTVHFGLGVVAAQEERYEEALKHFDLAVSIFPHFTAAWFNKATTQFKLGDYTGGIRSLQETVSSGMDKDIVKMARDRLSELELSIRKDRGLILEDYLKAADLFEKAFSLMQKKQWQEASKLFQDVLEIDPRHVQSWGNLGLLHATVGEKEKALDCLDRALALDPRYEPARMNRIAIERIEEGEPLEVPATTVEYYKEVHEKRKKGSWWPFRRG